MSKLQTNIARRKTFEVDFVEVTEENMEAVAEWCDGDIRTAVVDGEEKKYIRVRVHRPLGVRQTQAFVGDRVLYAGTGYKVYLPQAFAACFDEVEADN